MFPSVSRFATGFAAAERIIIDYKHFGDGPGRIEIIYVCGRISLRVNIILSTEKYKRRRMFFDSGTKQFMCIRVCSIVDEF